MYCMDVASTELNSYFKLQLKNMQQHDLISVCNELITVISKAYLITPESTQFLMVCAY